MTAIGIKAFIRRPFVPILVDIWLRVSFNLQCGGACSSLWQHNIFNLRF